MDRLRRLSSFWSWLPAFRVVAETEHLPRAGEALAVSPSALSRSIKLLEQDLGVELFRRSGQRLVLNEAGRRFLDANRLAMRTLHDSLEEISSELFHGVINIFSAGVITTAYVIPVLNEVRRRWPSLLPVLGGESKTVVAHLLSGKLDLAFHSYQVADPKLEGTHLGTVQSSVYCGEGHPLYRRRKISLDEVLEHEFVAPTPDANGQHVDGWPGHIPRRFGMHADQMRIGRDVCADGSLLAVLPDPMAAGGTHGQRLHRLPIEEDVLPPTHLFATYRPPLREGSSAQVIVDGIRKRIEADSRKARGSRGKGSSS